MSDWIVSDGPEDRCFGCGHQNPSGLRLRFRRLEGGGVETLYSVPADYAGAPGIVHGGIQAAILDEVLGFAVHDASGFDDSVNVVTVDFRLRYRRPVPTGTELHIVGRHVRSDGRDHYVEGDILDAEGQVLTHAEARWRRIDRPSPTSQD
jgi:acyl-coenzyme A thioesterase PaaI-like protein